MDFERELALSLPSDLPGRERVISLTARHLELVAQANERMNLTRITSPREACIKHVVDSLVPYSFFHTARTVLDAGSGAGFPGIPLAAAFPETRFLLTDSTQKKARFLEAAVAELGLENIDVSSDRAEDLLRHRRFDLITARAVAPVDRALALFAPAFKQRSRVLLYKGPDPAVELRDAASQARRLRVTMKVVMTYTLPDSLGLRSLVEIAPQ